jgi:hypothetical protein
MARRTLPVIATVVGAVLTLHVVSAAEPGPAARSLGLSPVAGADRSSEAVRSVTIPAGTLLRLRLDNAVGSDSSRIEDPVRGHLVSPVRIGGRTVLPAGSSVRGAVTSARRSGKVQGRARLGMRFYSITPAGEGESYRMSTRPWAAVAPGTKKKDAAKIAIPAAGGAIIGGVIGGKKGAAIGAAAGGGSGTAVVLNTRGKEVRLGRGAVVAVRLSAPLTVHLG